MHEFLECFYRNTPGTQLTLKDETFDLENTSLLAVGSDKKVFKHKDQNKCFFIPARTVNQEYWVFKINQEKKLVDQIISLGLKAQQYEIVPLKISEPQQSSYIIDVLLTKDFDTLCKEESIAIYDIKGPRDKKLIGNAPDFLAMKDRFKDTEFSQTMLSKIIEELAVALTFALPISIVHTCDDSEHHCFELPKDSNEAPVARYMFWDLDLDFSGLTIPILPTLEEFKLGTTLKYKRSIEVRPNNGLSRLAHNIAMTIVAIVRIKDETVDFEQGREFMLYVEDALLSALQDDQFLSNALDKTRRLTHNYLLKQIENIEIQKITITSKKFSKFLKAAISIDDFELLKRIFKLCPASAILSEECIQELMEFSNKFQNQLVTEYLATNLNKYKKTDLGTNPNNFYRGKQTDKITDHYTLQVSTNRNVERQSINLTKENGSGLVM